MKVSLRRISLFFASWLALIGLSNQVASSSFLEDDKGQKNIPFPRTLISQDPFYLSQAIEDEPLRENHNTTKEVTEILGCLFIPDRPQVIVMNYLMNPKEVLFTFISLNKLENTVETSDKILESNGKSAGQEQLLLDVYESLGILKSLPLFQTNQKLSASDIEKMKKLAAIGNADAMYKLGVHYTRENNWRKARHWLHCAFNESHSHPDSDVPFILGALYLLKEDINGLHAIRCIRSLKNYHANPLEVTPAFNRLKFMKLALDLQKVRTQAIRLRLLPIKVDLSSELATRCPKGLEGFIGHCSYYDMTAPSQVTNFTRLLKNFLNSAQISPILDVTQQSIQRSSPQQRYQYVRLAIANAFKDDKKLEVKEKNKIIKNIKKAAKVGYQPAKIDLAFHLAYDLLATKKPWSCFTDKQQTKIKKAITLLKGGKDEESKKALKIIKDALTASINLSISNAKNEEYQGNHQK